MLNKPAQTHDLIRVRDSMAVTADGAVPSWVQPSLACTPWVVVRRGYIQDGKIPVGVRGSIRSQRFAAWLAVSEIVERRSPEELWNDGVANHASSSLALSALSRVAPVLMRYGCRWGPSGSVGFELATSAPTVTASSDLDIVLRQPCRLKPDEVSVLQAALIEAAAPVKIDAMLETPLGGVLLAELAAAPSRVLVRTTNGPCLAVDPWAINESMEVLS